MSTQPRSLMRRGQWLVRLLPWLLLPGGAFAVGGRKVVVSVAVTATDEGPKLEHLTEDILFAGLRAEWPPDPKQRAPALPGLVVSYEPMKNAMTVLQALPLQGYALWDREAGTMKLRTWQELLAKMERTKELVAQGALGD